jgi:hypothetical protein
LKNVAAFLRKIGDINTPEAQKKLRMHLSMWAYAYESKSFSIVSDEEFDFAARQVDLGIETDRPDLDDWFFKNFSIQTGKWIHNHPDLARFERIWQTIYPDKKAVEEEFLFDDPKPIEEEVFEI